MRLLKLSALLMVLVLGAAFVACGDDDDDNGDTTPPATETEAPTEEPTEAPTEASTEEPTDEPTETPEATGTAEPTDEAEGTAIDVDMADFSFSPSTIQAPAGAPVTFNVDNVGGAPHTMTIYRDSGYTDRLEDGGTGTIGGGGSGGMTVTFDEATTYFFRCEIHPTAMQGTIEAE